MGAPMSTVPTSAGGVVGGGRRAHGRAHVQPMGGAQVTPSEVAQRTGRSRRTVMRAIQSGRLAARKLNDGWRIEPEDADAWANAHGPRIGTPMGGAQGDAQGRVLTFAKAVELGAAHGRASQLEAERDRERRRADEAEARAARSLARAEALESTLSTLRDEREAERRSHREHVADLRGRAERAERSEEEARATLAAVRDQAERERRRGFWGRLLRRGGPVPA